MAVVGEMQIHRLYRDILRAAKHFPSKKRDGLIRDIKAEFQDGKVQNLCICKMFTTQCIQGGSRNGLLKSHRRAVTAFHLANAHRI